MKILSIIGARPQFIKAAVFRLQCLENGIDEVLLHTGQHYDADMSSGLFDELGVKQPDIVHKLSERSHGGMTGELLYYIEKQIQEIKPDYLNVYGDTNSTLAGALAASKLHIPVIHIEAGLRSFNKTMPEEINRILTDHVSDYLFCPTTEAVKNLYNENIVKGVHHVGDIMYDAVKIFKNRFKLPNALKILPNKKLALMTLHRADTTADPERLAELINYCKSFLDEYQVIFPAHPNTKNKLKEFSINIGAIEQLDPVSYLEMQALINEAQLVLTDSGGLQKEAYFHKTPCITLRDETEWVETIASGWNRLWMSKEEMDSKQLISDYGDGNCAEKIIELINVS
jgi:UDP-GlcNAc3NAcA epimerase